MKKNITILTILMIFIVSSVYSQNNNFNTYHISKKFNDSPNTIYIRIISGTDTLFQKSVNTDNTNFNETTGIFSYELKIDNENIWTKKSDYVIDIDDTKNNIQSIPFANVTQNLAETDTVKNYITILHNGKYLYVDKYNCNNGNISTSYFNNTNNQHIQITDTICKNKYININGIELKGHIPDLSELLSISKQTNCFKTVYDNNNNEINNINLDFYYFYKDINNNFYSIKIFDMSKYPDPIYSNQSGFLRCVYTE